MKIINHLLYRDDGTPYLWVRSPNIDGKVQAKYLIIHYTAQRNAEAAIRTLTDPHVNSRVSAHLVIGRNGSITQLVPFDTVAWHAGKSTWKGLHDLNQYSLGIELDNAGPLTHRSDGKWYSWFKEPYPDEEVIQAAHKQEPAKIRGWHKYTQAQLDSVLEVATLLVKHYRLRDVLGHDDIAPGRKIDPGPAFHTKEFRAQVFKGMSEVVVSYLNIRTGPGREYDTLGTPLSKGTLVQVLALDEEEPRWKRVEVFSDGRIGWINSEPLDSPTTLQPVSSSS